MTAILLTLNCLGVPLSWKKCELGPSLRWLGFLIDVPKCILSIPEDKMQKILDGCKAILMGRVHSRQDVQKWLGRVQWMSTGWPFIKPWGLAEGNPTSWPAQSSGSGAWPCYTEPSSTTVGTDVAILPTRFLAGSLRCRGRRLWQGGRWWLVHDEHECTPGRSLVVWGEHHPGSLPMGFHTEVPTETHCSLRASGHSGTGEVYPCEVHLKELCHTHLH